MAIDAAIIVILFTVIIGALLAFLFGLRRQNETPQVIIEESQSKFTNKKKTKKESKAKVLPVASQSPITTQIAQQKAEDKPKIQVQQATSKSTPKPIKIQQINQIEPVMTQSLASTENIAQSGLWITVEDKKQKKAQKKLQKKQQNQENETSKIQTKVEETLKNQFIKENSAVVEQQASAKESPKVDKTPKVPQEDTIKLHETDNTMTKSQEQQAKVSSIAQEPPVETLIKDAVDDEWILPSKNNKKKLKKKRENTESKEEMTSSLTSIENFKETQLDESIILIENKFSTDNNSSSDSVQEVEDGTWAAVKPKSKKVRREK